jgi:tetratricopeptide (TPR) repeat protein
MIDPNDESTYLRREMAYMVLCYYSKAISDLKKAIEIDHYFDTAYYLRGELKLHFRRFTPVLPFLNRLFNPNYLLSTVFFGN